MEMKVVVIEFLIVGVYMIYSSWKINKLSFEVGILKEFREATIERRRRERLEYLVDKYSKKIGKTVTVYNTNIFPSMTTGKLKQVFIVEGKIFAIFARGNKAIEISSLD